MFWPFVRCCFTAHPNVDVSFHNIEKKEKSHLSYKIIYLLARELWELNKFVKQILLLYFLYYFWCDETSISFQSLLLVVVNAAPRIPDSYLKAFPLTVYSLSCFPWSEVLGRCISNTRPLNCSVSVLGVGSLRESPVWPWKLVTKEALFRCWYLILKAPGQHDSLLLNKLQFAFTEAVHVFLFLFFNHIICLWYLNYLT